MYSTSWRRARGAPRYFFDSLVFALGERRAGVNFVYSSADLRSLNATCFDLEEMSKKRGPEKKGSGLHCFGLDRKAFIFLSRPRCNAGSRVDSSPVDGRSTARPTITRSTLIFCYLVSYRSSRCEPRKNDIKVVVLSSSAFALTRRIQFGPTRPTAHGDNRLWQRGGRITGSVSLTQTVQRRPIRKSSARATKLGSPVHCARTLITRQRTWKWSSILELGNFFDKCLGRGHVPRRYVGIAHELPA